MRRLAELQNRFGVAICLAGILVSAACLPAVSRLGLDSEWRALLPASAPAVRDLDAADDRLGTRDTLTVAIKADVLHAAAAHELADVLRAQVGELPFVQIIDWDRNAAVTLRQDHRLLYASLTELEQLHDDLIERREWNERAVSPIAFVEGAEPPTVERLLLALDGDRSAQSAYYGESDGSLQAFFVRVDLTQVSRGDAVERVDALVDQLDEDTLAELEVVLAGPIVLHLEEEASIARELVVATVVTSVLVLLLVWFFFRELRAVALLGGGLIAPVMVTFAIAEMTVDDLNTSTLFLASIVIGNGVNPNIIWLARFVEERRNGHDLTTAIARTHSNAWLGTLTASMAAAVAYASLMVTDFRGFRDFGVVGGVGMISCWIGSLGLLPALSAVVERLIPFAHSSEGSARSLYTALFTRLVFSRPKTVIALSVVVTLASTVMVSRIIVEDPLEHDFRQLQSDRSSRYSPAMPIDERLRELDAGASTDDMVVVLDHRADAQDFERTLEALADEGAPWGEVHSLDDLLPQEQQVKLPVIAGIRDALLGISEHVDDEDLRDRVLAALPSSTPTLVDDAHLPAELTWRFAERDGSVGRLLRVEPDGDTWDGRYLSEWAGRLREVRTPQGEVPTLVGRAPIFADITQTVLRDGPKAVLLALLATMLLSFVTFRSLRERLVTVMSLLLGIVWMAGGMVLVGMRLNFLNFVAFPISFGNGVDYAVNVMRRYVEETAVDHEERVLQAIRATGGAVVLCSLTTVIGYSVLYSSGNHAINSFGGAMVISEITCLLAAVLTMPAVLILLARRRSVRDRAS